MQPSSLAALFAIAFLVGVDEFLLGPILAPIGSELGVAPAHVALYVAAYNLPLAILAPVFGAASDRHGRHVILIPSILLFGAASVATASAPNFEIGLISRLVTGIGSAGMLPVAFAIAADKAGKDSGRSISIVQSGLTLGIILSPGLGALLSQLFSWRAAFGGLGVASLAAALPAALLLRSAQTRQPEGVASETGFSRMDAFRAIATLFLGLGVPIGIFSILGQRLRDLYALDTVSVGVVLAGFGLITVAGNLALPRAIGFAGGIHAIVRLSLLGLAGAIAALFATASVTIAIAIVGIVAWALLGGLMAPALQTHIADLSNDSRGQLIALAGSALNLGAAAASGLSAALYGDGTGAIALAGVLCIGLAAILFARAPGNRTECGNPAPENATG